MRAYLRCILIAFLVNICNSSELEDAGMSDEDQVDNLIATLRNDAYLDLPADEEYDDLRAEVLAAHTVLHQLRAESARKSLVSTPCWQLGGVCVHHELCQGSRFLTQVRGCKNKLNVCCFNWNQYRVRDLRDKGASFSGYPWRSPPLYYLNKFNRKPGDQKGKEKKSKKKKKDDKMRLNAELQNNVNLPQVINNDFDKYLQSSEFGKVPNTPGKNSKLDDAIVYNGDPISQFGKPLYDWEEPQTGLVQELPYLEEIPGDESIKLIGGPQPYEDIPTVIE